MYMPSVKRAVAEKLLVHQRRWWRQCRVSRFSSFSSGAICHLLSARQLTLVTRLGIEPKPGVQQPAASCFVRRSSLRNVSSAPTSSSDFPSSADAVVIGGGSMGCNTLYHLTKLGVRNAVLLEKDSLTAGTTWHTAGLVWRLRPSDTEIQLLGYGRDLIKSLEAETGVAPGWNENGGLFVASSKARLDEYKRLKTIGHDFGIESFLLGPKETKKLYPLMNVADVYGTLYSPGDGTIDPAGFCDALTRAAKSRGGQVVQKCEVTGILSEESWSGGRKVVGVQTNLGTIKTDCVINCASRIDLFCAWATRIGRFAGVPVPLSVMKHAYVVTERIEGIQNMPNVRDHDSSIYLRLQGDALSVGGYEESPIFIEQLAKDFAFSLYEMNWDVFGCHIDGAVNRVPAIGQVGIKSTVCGPESFTPDHKPLMGEDPNVRGFYHGCAMNSAGMMLGGGCGWQLAEWVVHGRPSLDMFGYDIRRFDPTLVKKGKWVRDRSHEAYAKNYSIVLSHDEPLAGRAHNKGALYETLLQQGCVYEDRQGFERPGWFNSSGLVAPPLPYDYYGSYGVPANVDYVYKNVLADEYTFDFPPHHAEIEKQCQVCRSAAAVFDMSYFGKFYMTGSDAQKCADYIFTNDVRKNPGSSVYTCMLNARGGIESDLTVSVLDGSHPLLPCEPDFEGRGFYVAAGGGSWYQALSHIRSVIDKRKFDVQIANCTRDMSLISVQGPASRSILEKIVDVDLSNDAFPFSAHQLATVDGRYLVRMLRLSFVGELGWELHVPNESAVQVYHAVKSAGRDLGVVDAGYRALDSLSIEKGYRHWHADVRLDTTPHEAGLAFTCKLKTGIDFLGREVVERQKEEGVSKRIACFTIDEKVPLFGLETIWKNGRPVGHLYRGEYAFTVGKSMGYGYIRSQDGSKITRSQIKEGDYELEIMCRKVKAQVHVQSPFDPGNRRVQGLYN